MPALVLSLRRRRWMARSLVAALAALFMALPAMPGAAQVRNLFVVEDVRVDETAENAEAAREKAIAGGERRAFELLLERITAPEDRARLAAPAQTAIEPLIKDFWISEEKASRVRYIAVLNFNFRPQPVRDFLRRNGVSFVTQPAPPAAVVPVFRSEAGLLLWEEGNPWRAAWAGEAGTSLRPLRTPAASDGLSLSAEQAVAGDAAALSALAQRLEADETVVAIAEIVPPPQPEQALELRLILNRQDRAGRSESTPVTLRGRVGEDAASLLKRGAKETALVLDAAWKGQRRTTPKPTAVAATDVIVDGLGEWLDIRKRLGRIDAIEGVNVVLFAGDRVRINLVYATSPEELANVLRISGLALTTGPDAWTLRLGEAADAVADPAAAQAPVPARPGPAIPMLTP
jgi:hypothetical protein